MKHATKPQSTRKRMGRLLPALAATLWLLGCGGGDASDDQGAEAPPDKRVIVPDRGQGTTNASVDAESGR